MKSCTEIFEYSLAHQDHTEGRLSDNGAELTVRVRNEMVLVVLECKRCKSRKIEVVIRECEKLL